MLTAKQLIGGLRAMIDHIEKNVEAELTGAKPTKAASKAPASAATQSKETVEPAASTTALVAGVLATAQAATNNLAPPPVTAKEAADALRAMVNSGLPGCTRDDAVKLIESFGVATMAQIPPARLADFAQKCKDAVANAGKTAPAAEVDPLGGLLN